MKVTLLFAIAAVAFAQQAPVKIVLVGDSTVNDQGGWGPGFRESFKNVEVVNLAKNGRSTKSFRDEGTWKLALDSRPNYVLIQFGHNDVPGKGADRETDAGTTYRENLVRFIDEARAIGAEPVLVTSIVRRNFGADGKIKADSLVPYVAAVKVVAAEKRVAVMDMYARTMEHAERLGPEGNAEIDARDAEGKRDHTHLGARGRAEIGAIAAGEFVGAVPGMGIYLVK